MTSLWNKVAMIMLVGLLIAGPVGRLPHAAADNSALAEAHTALGAALAAQAQAQKQYPQMKSHMDSLKTMAMTANEKAMMNGAEQMAAAMKSLMQVDHQLIVTARTELQAAGDGVGRQARAGARLVDDGQHAAGRACGRRRRGRPRRGRRR